MKTALVLEGGAMQGLYTAGVLDVFMEQGIQFDAIVGVSAGALFGVNFLSRQKGRVIRYNQRFNREKGYMGFGTLLRTGNIIDTHFAYERVPRELDPFDDVEYRNRSRAVPFYAVVTNIRSGEPEYIRITSVFEQMDVLRASGSMPFVSTPVRLGNDLYLDGAITDSIPYRKMQEMGYERLVVVLTKSVEYRLKPLPKLPNVLLYAWRFPRLAKCIRERHIMYNGQLDGLTLLQEQGVAKVLRPSRPLYIQKLEKDPEEMKKLYALGREDALRYLSMEKQ